MGRNRPPLVTPAVTLDVTPQNGATFKETMQMSVTPLPRWYTIPAAAEAAEVSPWTLRKEVAEGRLQVRRINRLVRVLDSELARWMRDGGETASHGRSAS
jgi:hypothetical protein